MTLLAFITLVAGAAIPLAVAFLTKQETSPVKKSLISVVLAGLTAAGTALAGVGDLGSDWKKVVAAAIVASVAAGGTLASTWADTIVKWVHDVTDEWAGIG
jgi:hypothetical protein